MESVLEAAGLFFAPFLHESVAFVAGAFLVHSGRMHLTVCLGALLAGVIASDLAIYGLGRLGRTHPRIRALLPAGAQPVDLLDRHLPWLIPLCRFVPGLLFTTFAAAGLMGLDFRRFAAITVLTACVYTPALLWAVLQMGDAATSPGRLWPWLAILAGMFVLALLTRHLAGKLMERRLAWRASAG